MAQLCPDKNCLSLVFVVCSEVNTTSGV